MENEKEPIKPITWVAIGVAVIFVAGYFGFQLYQGFQKQILESEQRSKKQQDLLSKQQEELEQAKKEIDDIKNQKPQIIIKQSDSPAITGTQNNPPSLSTIIAKWRPAVVYIECNFRYANTGNIISTNAGSGMVISDGDELTIVLTNKHIVSNEKGYVANECNIMFPDYDKVYKAINTYPNSDNQIRTSNKLDATILLINYPDSYVKKISSGVATCTQKASIGDEVVILGYPTIGSQYDITATRGIVSGYDGDYYITDAKIEHGNSGGAAILVKDNCYLGIPTYVLAGEVESLARILDARIIFDPNK